MKFANTLTQRLYLGLALFALLLLAGAAITFTTQSSSAQTPDAGAACMEDDEHDDGNEDGAEDDDADESAAEEADTDALEEECDSQDEEDDDAQQPQLNGSIAVDEAQYVGLTEDDEAAALSGLALIDADAAVAAAQAAVAGDATNVELDNENGSLVYSVDIGGQDVKVDAGTGEILHIDADGDED